MKLVRLGLFAFFLCMVLPVAGFAETVTGISVQGSQRVDEASVKSYLTFKEGDQYSAAEMNASVKSLYATNLFSDIKIYKQDGQIIINVTENPIISQVVFEGNKTLQDDKLQGEVTLKSRSIYTKAAVQNDVQRIAELYRKNGRYNAVIEPKVILKDQNRVDLVYEIKEGKETVIKKIVFIGNKTYTDAALRGVIQSAETRWYNFFNDNDKYDSDRLEYDKELLRRYYTKNGFADFKISSAVSELTPDRDGFILNFTINEGKKYKFGKIQIITQLQDLKADQLDADKDTIQTKEGKDYDSSKLEKTVDNITEKAGQKGFAFVDVDPKLNRDPQKQTIDVTYVVKEGPKVYVNRINVNGNTRTLDSVIRREFRLSEGDPFNSSAVRRSKERLDNLGYFKKVDIKRERTDDPDKVDLDTTVDEKSTGELNFGAGYSTVDGVIGQVSLNEKNFLGRGQKVGINLSASQRRQEGQISFTEPHIFDKDLAAGFDIFSLRRDEQSDSSYDSKSVGVNLRTGYEVNEHLRHDINYKISKDEITNVSANASRFIRDQAGETVTSLIGQSLTYDQRDNKSDPTRGYVLKGDQELAGLGGDVKFIRHEVNGSYYVPLTEDKELRFMLAGNAGNVTGYGDKDVRIDQRFFVGGQNLRGFERGGIGPRDTLTDDALGGDNYYTATAEVGFPLGLPDDLGFRGAVFTDVGSLWHIDESGADIYDSADPRVSVGAGVSWASPFGPIRVDFAVPVVKNENDREEVFQLNFGTRF